MCCRRDERMTARGTLRTLAIALVLGANLTTLARAQASMFYREEVKEGRVYVFAHMDEYARWAKSNGDMSKPTSRVGYGPQGETVVFDSEDAINLYNFKHDRPGEIFQKQAGA